MKALGGVEDPAEDKDKDEDKDEDEVKDEVKVGSESDFEVG